MIPVALGLHDALLDPATGNGILLFPAGPDVVLGPSSLHVADHDAAVRILEGLGWEPRRDNHGQVMNEGVTTDGRESIGLFGRGPLASGADLDACIAALAELVAVAGIIPSPRHSEH